MSGYLLHERRLPEPRAKKCSGVDFLGHRNARTSTERVGAAREKNPKNLEKNRSLDAAPSTQAQCSF